MAITKTHRTIFWWLWRRCSPLPIPNREVKPVIADDTAFICGKVGRRQSFLKSIPYRMLFFCRRLVFHPALQFSFSLLFDYSLINFLFDVTESDSIVIWLSRVVFFLRYCGLCRSVYIVLLCHYRCLKVSASIILLIGFFFFCDAWGFHFYFVSFVL